MVNRDNPDTMGRVLELLEQRLAGRRVIRYMAGTEIIEVSAEEFLGRIRKRACVLTARGLGGKHIGIMGRNSCDWLVNFCAIFQAGAVGVLLDKELDPATIGELAARVDLAAILYDCSTEGRVMQAETPRMVQKISMDGSGDGEDLCEDPPAVLRCEPGPEELSCIFFTSGTTVKSKAVMMSGRAMAASVCTNVNSRRFEALLAVMPFHHLAGFITVMNALYLGAEVCIAEDLKYFYRYLASMKPDYAFLVPSMLQMLARKLKNGGLYGSRLGWNLRLIDCGGAVFCAEFLRMLLDHGITVMQGYGASEAGGIGFFWEMTPDRPDTIGKPPAGLEIKIEDGEIFLRSESVMMGYYDDPEETAKVLHDGWYATGDLCREDEEGYLYLTGRRKNLIILSNGENVSPEEIETKLQTCCGAIEEIMVGVEGSLITARVFPHVPPGSSESEQERIRDEIREAVGQYNDQSPVYKQIQKLYFLDQPFTKNTAGKIIRHNTSGREFNDSSGS